MDTPMNSQAFAELTCAHTHVTTQSYRHQGRGNMGSVGPPKSHSPRSCKTLPSDPFHSFSSPLPPLEYNCLRFSSLEKKKSGEEEEEKKKGQEKEKKKKFHFVPCSSLVYSLIFLLQQPTPVQSLNGSSPRLALPLVSMPSAESSTKGFFELYCSLSFQT